MAELVAAVGHGWLKVDPNTPGLDGLREALRQFAMSLTRKGIAYSGKRTGAGDMVVSLALAVRAARLPELEACIDVQL